MKIGIANIEGRERVVLRADGDEVVDLTSALELTPAMLVPFLARKEAPELCRAALKSAATRLPLQEARLAAPLLQPGKLIGIGMNYHSFVAAAEKIGMPVPAERIWFLRPASSITGPSQPVWLPENEASLDYEVELAIIIGHRSRNLTVAEASQAIGGFTVANDLTLRERVRQSITLAKGFETHTPLGPWIVTPDEIPEVQNLRVQTRVNGELRQDSSTAEMILNCAQLIAELSASLVLSPGDVILTGTPAGSGLFERPPRWLRPGDTVRVEIEGVGALENRVVMEPG